MRIVVLTSKDHIYANVILNSLIKKGALDSHNVIVLEQDSIVPNKTVIEGLKRYLIKSGIYYILAQATKQYIFKIVRLIALVKKNVNSNYYPYYHNPRVKLVKRSLNHINLPENILYIRKMNPDLILSLYSKEIVPQSIISLPKYGAINLHPALLPSYRGVSPTFWCLVNNEMKSGATLHYLDDGIDTGRIISQSEITTSHIRTEHQLYLMCTNLGVNLLVKFLNNYQKTPKYVPSSDIKPSYNSLPTKLSINKFLVNGYRFYRVQEFF